MQRNNNFSRKKSESPILIIFIQKTYFYRQLFTRQSYQIHKFSSLHLKQEIIIIIKTLDISISWNKQRNDPFHAISTIIPSKGCWRQSSGQRQQVNDGLLIRRFDVRVPGRKLHARVPILWLTHDRERMKEEEEEDTRVYTSRM